MFRHSQSYQITSCNGRSQSGSIYSGTYCGDTNSCSAGCDSDCCVTTSKAAASSTKRFAIHYYNILRYNFIYNGPIGSMDTDNQFQSATTSEAVIPITLQVMAGQNAAPTGRECACQVFFRQLPGLNNWKFIFTISPKEHLSVRI